MAAALSRARSSSPWPTWDGGWARLARNLKAEIHPDLIEANRGTVSLLVEFERGHVPVPLGMARLERELATILGRKVDLRTPEDLSRNFRHQVVAEAEVQCAQE